MKSFTIILSFILITFLTISCNQYRTIDSTNFIYNGKVKKVTTTYYEMRSVDSNKIIKADSLIAFLFIEEFDKDGNTLSQYTSVPGFKIIDRYIYENNQLNSLNETWDNGKIKKEYIFSIKANSNEFKAFNYDSLTKITSVIHIVYNNDKSKKSKETYSTFNNDTISITRNIYSTTIDTNNFIFYARTLNGEKIDTTTFVTKVKDKNKNAVELIEWDNNKATYYVTKNIVYY